MIYPLSDMYKEGPTSFDWAKYYLTWLTPYLREKLYSTKLNETDQNFYMGIRYQYGIDIKKDLKKATECYTKSADQGSSVSMYKLAELMLENYKNGGILDRQQQLYLRFKALAYLDPRENEQFKGIDISLQIANHLDKEDRKLQKFHLLLQKFSEIKDQTEIKYIKAKRCLKFYLDQEDLATGISILQELASNQLHLQSAYSLAVCYSSDKNKFIKKDLGKAEQYFRMCQIFKYYKAYYEFGRLLFQTGRHQQAMKIFSEGYENGYYCCLFNVISYNFWNLNLKNLQYLEKILDLQIIDIITGNLYSIFEFIYIKKVLKNHCPKYMNQYHNRIEKQIIIVVKEFYELQRFKQIRCKDQIITSYTLMIKFGYITSNLEQQDMLITEAIHETQTRWLKRYCIRFLFKVRYERCYGNKKLDKVKIPSTEELEILKKTEKQLFTRFNQMLNNQQNSSYYFFFAKIYERGWGIQKSQATSFLFLNKAVEWLKTKKLNISFVQFFRAAKAKRKLMKLIHNDSVKKLEYWCNQTLKQSPHCQICYQNQKQVIFYSCKHMSCRECYLEVIKMKNICHLCRKQILSVNNVNCFKEVTMVEK